jgi:type IV secretory pathway VirB6-like protein
MAEKGNVVPYIYNAPNPVDRDPFMDEVVWSNNTITFSGRYIFYNSFSVFADYRISDIQGYDVDGKSAQQYLDMFTPSFFHGSNNIFTFGMQLGF